MCDVEFRVHGESLKAHKIVLCSASNFFQVMFESEFRESKENLVDLSASFSDIRHLRAFLDYIYKGEIFLTSDSVQEILNVSVQFLLEELKGHCTQFLLENLRPQHALSTWYTATLYNLRELEEIARAVSYNTFCRQLLFDKSLESLSAMFLASAVRDSSLNINSIDRVELVLHWLSFDLENRMESAEELLENFLSQNPLPVNYSIESQTFSNCRTDFQNWLKSRFSKLLENQRCRLEPKSCSVAPVRDEPELSWCLMLQEENHHSAAFYCTKNKTWFSCPLTCEYKNIIGLVSPNHLAVKMYGTQIFLVDMITEARKPIANILNILPQRYTLVENTFDFFCDDGSLYAVVTAFSQPIRKPFFKVSRYNAIADTWNFCMDVHYDFCGDEMDVGDQASVSLKVHTGQSSDHYLMATISTKRRIGPKTTSNIDACVFRFQEMKNFHVIKFDPNHKSYESCGIRWHDPVSLDQLPTLILSDKICFLRLDHQLLTEKLRMSFIDQEECYMDGVCLVLAGQFWEKVTIGVPSPNLTPLPMTINDDFFYKVHVSNLFNKLFVGIHRSPHVYEVAVYDLEHFSATILPSISLPAVNNISMSALTLHTSIATWVKDVSKSLDTTSFCFSEFLLKKCSS